MYVKLDPMRLARAARARVRRVAGTAASDESGFTVTESVTAIFILVLVALALVSSITMAIRGVLTGRQRTSALAVAEGIMEEVRSVTYDRVGHDLGDATLTDPDSDFWFDGTNYRYDPNGAAGEPLALAREDAVVGGPSADPVGPLSGHHSTGTLDATEWDAWIYITHADTSGVDGGDPHKRVSVLVEFTGEQFDAEAVENRAKISSLVFESHATPPALVTASAEADAGIVTTSGGLEGNGFQSLTATFPHTFSELRIRQYREANGWSHSAHGQLVDDSGAAATGDCTASGTTATCPMASPPPNLAVSDDPNSGFPQYASDARTAPDGTMGGSGYQIDWDGGSVAGELSACYGMTGACGPVFGAGGAADNLPYSLFTGDGPHDLDAPFTVSVTGALDVTVNGSIYSSSGANHSEAEIDIDSAGTAATDLTTPTAVVTAPAVDIFTVNDPLGVASALTVAEVSAYDTRAFAPVGPTAGSADVDAQAVTVTVAGTPLTTVTPGSGEVTDESGSEMVGGITAVEYQVTVTSGTEDVASQDPDGVGYFTEAHAVLIDALRVVVDAQIVVCPSSSTDLLCDGVSPQTVADVQVELDYGDLDSRGSVSVP